VAKRLSARRRALLADLQDTAQETQGLAVFFQTAIAAQAGLHATDMQALGVLLRRGEPVTAGDLAGVTGLTTGAVTRLVDRLERDGYVARRRDDLDRRKVWITAVPERLDEIAGLYRDVALAHERLLSDYSDDELELIRDYQRRANQVGWDLIGRMPTSNGAEAQVPVRR
jgi:DNA-binding MarR family transcriptional regulator